ncbi:hypothetical protein [Aurantimonas aggregata]|nr:hypothetical protein [Aurantimonas aggregata]
MMPGDDGGEVCSTVLLAFLAMAGLAGLVVLLGSIFAALVVS